MSCLSRSSRKASEPVSLHGCAVSAVSAADAGLASPESPFNKPT